MMRRLRKKRNKIFICMATCLPEMKCCIIASYTMTCGSIRLIILNDFGSKSDYTESMFSNSEAGTILYRRSTT